MDSVGLQGGQRAQCWVGVEPAPHSNPSSSSEWEPHLKEWVLLCVNHHVILTNRMPFYLPIFVCLCLCVSTGMHKHTQGA